MTAAQPCGSKHKIVREITLDLSSSMILIARRPFPKATVTNDHFHVHNRYYETFDELRISPRWMARDIENKEIARCRKEGIPYVPFRYANGDTRKHLLARAKYFLTKMHRNGPNPRSGGPTSSLKSTLS